MKQLLLVVAFLSLALQSAADVPYNAWWQKANRYYQQKQYDSAAYYYEKLSGLNPENEVIYYNLGNTYYRLNRIGPAVLNYERALKLRPGYRDAADNLELTQSRIGNRIRHTPDIFFVSWWKTVTHASLAEVWSVASLVLFLIALALLAWSRWNSPRSVPMQAPLLAFFCCLCTLVFAFAGSSRDIKRKNAVVMMQDTPLRSSATSPKQQTLIPEGTVLRVESVRAGWAEVELPDGRSGWMPANALVRI